MAQAKRDFELKKATYDTEVQPAHFSQIRIRITIFQLGRGGDKIFVQLGEHSKGRGRDGLPAAGFQGERQDQGGGDAGNP